MQVSEFVWTEDRITHIGGHNIPDTDSIRELATFWDTHDVTDFADKLVEVAEPVFARRSPSEVIVPLSADERRALREVAASRGLNEAELIRTWVLEKLHH